MIEEAIENAVRRGVRQELGAHRACTEEPQPPARDGEVELLAVAEAAELLRISRNLTYELIKQERLHALRLGRRLLIPRWAITELAGREVPDPRGACRYCGGQAAARYRWKNQTKLIAPIDLCSAATCHEELLGDLRTTGAVE